MLGGSVVSHQHRIPEVFQLGIIRMSVIPHLAIPHLSILYTTVEQELLDLVAADIAEDPAVFLLLIKPVRSALWRADPVGTESVDMDGRSDGSC